ncbi:13335_t:CDS:2, partial [Funneliformis geosporum]
MGGISANMLKHLKEGGKEIRNTLHNLDNKTKKNKHKHPRIEFVDSDNDGFVSDSGSDMVKAQRLMRQLREIINKLPSNENEFKTLMKRNKLLQIQEDAYSLFCILYSDKDNNAFIDECLKLTKNLLRYWQTVLLYASNLAEFAYRFFSISPNSAISER